MSNNGSLNKSVARRKTHKFTAASSERELTYRNVPLRAVLDFNVGWRAKHPAPPIPAPMANVAGEMRATPNPSDPDYQQAVSDYEQAGRDAGEQFLFQNAIVLSEDDRAEVAEYRDMFNALALGTQLDKTDEVIFATHLVCLTVEEEIELTNAIYRISQPTREVVNQFKERFPN